jgi:CDP-diacylglycerol--glycerol-3-phosphate 3-phosphatidyltransferase
MIFAVPTVYGLKPRFQRLLRPLTAWLVKLGFTANQVTLAAAGLSLLAGLLIALFPAARWPFLLLPPVLLIRMALNAMDGMMARDHGMKTPLGALLNEMGDVFSDLALYAPFAFALDVPAPMASAFLALLVASEMIGVVAVQIGASRRYDGPLGKSDRAFAFGVLGLLSGLGVPAGAWLNGLWAILCLLELVTLVNRGGAALREVRP